MYRRWFDEVINERNLSLAEGLLAPGYRLHFPGLPEPLDAAGHLRMLSTFLSGFSDWQETVEDVIAEDDRVAVRMTGRGTHDGDFQGIPATGRAVLVEGVGIGRVAGQQIVEAWAAYDALGMLQQLGAVPGPTATASA